LAIVYLSSCFDESENSQANRSSSFEQTEKLERLRRLNHDLNWEVNRLKPKVPSVPGKEMAKSKVTGLWYHDVQREPFTGRAIEKSAGGAWSGEVSFFEGKKDGVERYWHPNGQLRVELQWMSGKLHGFATEWDNLGNLLARKRFHEGEEVVER
jgi:antitoxin component YwqK of YwqJK toxin-antitoxin module